MHRGSVPQEEVFYKGSIFHRQKTSPSAQFRTEGGLLLRSLDLRTQGRTAAEHSHMREYKQAENAVPEQNPSGQAPEIGALIGGLQLNDSIEHQRKQQGKEHGNRRVAEPRSERDSQRSDELSGAAGADRKALSTKTEGAVRPAVAAHYDGQPLVEPANEPVQGYGLVRATVRRLRRRTG